MGLGPVGSEAYDDPSGLRLRAGGMWRAASGRDATAILGHLGYAVGRMRNEFRGVWEQVGGLQTAGLGREAAHGVPSGVK